MESLADRHHWLYGSYSAMDLKFMRSHCQNHSQGWVVCFKKIFAWEEGAQVFHEHMRRSAGNFKESLLPSREPNLGHQA